MHELQAQVTRVQGHVEAEQLVIELVQHVLSGKVNIKADLRHFAALQSSPPIPPPIPPPIFKSQSADRFVVVKAHLYMFSAARPPPPSPILLISEYRHFNVSPEIGRIGLLGGTIVFGTLFA